MELGARCRSWVRRDVGDLLDQHNISLLAVDPTQENNSVSQRWQATGYPSTYLIDEDRTVVAVILAFQDPNQLDQQVKDLNW